MTREERFKMDTIDEFKQMCEIVEKDGRIIVNKQRMLKALEQEPKTGHWIYPYETTTLVSICSECGAYGRGNFCPNCGARMVDPQESEDKG